MKKKTIQRRFVTLVEMMIVMFLIAMITGVIAYNYTGSLEEGKAFRTKAGMDKIQTILDLHLATHPEDKDGIETKWQTIVYQSHLVKNPKDAINDGWGNPYEVTTNENHDIVIRSEKYESYKLKTNKSSLFDDQRR